MQALLQEEDFHYLLSEVTSFILYFTLVFGVKAELHIGVAACTNEVRVEMTDALRLLPKPAMGHACLWTQYFPTPIQPLTSTNQPPM